MQSISIKKLNQIKKEYTKEYQTYLEKSGKAKEDVLSLTNQKEQVLDMFLSYAEGKLTDSKAKRKKLIECELEQ